MQEIIVGQVAKELDVATEPPAWLRDRDATRVLQAIQKNQRNVAGPWKFKFDVKGPWGEFNWTAEKDRDRLQLLFENGCLEKAGGDFYQLSNWEEFRRR